MRGCCPTGWLPTLNSHLTYAAIAAVLPTQTMGAWGLRSLDTVNWTSTTASLRGCAGSERLKHIEQHRGRDLGSAGADSWPGGGGCEAVSSSRSHGSPP